MTSILTSDQREQLQPVLGSIARLISFGKSTTDDQLRRLLSAVNLDDNADAMAELRLWVRLLVGFYADPSEDTRETVVESLMLRGVPQAPAQLALKLINPTAHVVPDPSPNPLSASSDQLDFGILSAGLSRTMQIKVTGGPGRVETDSKQVQAMPDHFGPAMTTVSVTVHPGPGSVLLTPLSLSTPSSTIEVPIVAQWETESTKADSSAAVAPTNTASRPIINSSTRVDETSSGLGRLGQIPLNSPQAGTRTSMPMLRHRTAVEWKNFRDASRTWDRPVLNSLAPRLKQSLSFDRTFFRSAAGNDRSTLEALTVFGGALALWSYGWASFQAHALPNVLVFLIHFGLITLPMWAIWPPLTWYLASKLGGSATLGGHVRAVAYASAPMSLGSTALFPALGSLTLVIGVVWALMATFVAIDEVQQFDKSQKSQTDIWLMLLAIGFATLVVQIGLFEVLSRFWAVIGALLGVVN